MDGNADKKIYTKPSIEDQGTVTDLTATFGKYCSKSGSPAHSISQGHGYRRKYSWIRRIRVRFF